MNIRTSPDPVLRKACAPVEPAELKDMAKLAKKMARLMYKADGCGIAAPQVGVSKQLIVLDTTKTPEGEKRVEEPVVLLNPRVVRLGEETDCGGEGCLSLPGITVDVERSTFIEVEALDLEGNEILIEAEGFDARALQHELDHLEGITLFEHLDSLALIAKLQEYEEAKANGAKPGETGGPDE